MIGGSGSPETEGPPFDIWRYDYATNAWELIWDSYAVTASAPDYAEVEKADFWPAHILSATYDPQRDRLLILGDVTKNSGRFARLWALPLGRRIPQLLGNWPRVGEFDRIELGPSEDGRLIMVSARTSDKRLEILKLRLQQDKVVEEAEYSTKGLLRAAPRADYHGVHLALQEKSGKIKAERVKWKKLESPCHHNTLASCVR